MQTSFPSGASVETGNGFPDTAPVGTLSPVRPTRLDHVALWVTDPDGIAGRTHDLLGFHEIERSDAFILVGADARSGKLTLFTADGPRTAGALVEIGLRAPGLAEQEVVELGDELRLRLTAGDPAEPADIDHVALLASNPRSARQRWLELGFELAPPAAGGVLRARVGPTFVELRPGAPGSPARPLLNHLGVLVESVEEVERAGSRPELGEVELVDAENTVAAFVTGPDGVRLEYVAHKPTFSLR
jgi:catechol 2,3-dioxygenase-like lactoylglutathione lyase family enzyme